MRILRLEADNIKRVKAVDITPEGNVVVISGKNGAGKSSTIDAIWLALSYRAASKSNPYPLRAGEEKGHAGPLDLGDYIVTRTFTESGTSLKVTTPDGSTIRSPQKVLDGMIGDLAFDPWAFARLKNAEQRQMLGDLLFNLTEGEVNLAEFDSKRQQLYEERTELNREKRRLTGVLTSFRPPVDADPREEVSIADLSRSIADGIEINNRIQAIKESNQRAVSKIAEVDRVIQQLKEEKLKAQEALRTQTSELEQLQPVDVATLQTQLSNIETLNARAREIQSYDKTNQTLINLGEDISKINARMELLEIEKDEALESSELPVSGIRVTADGIMVVTPEEELVPFCQASAAQRLRISLGIAMASNPTLRVIRIADGSLLDDESMEIIREMADDQDFQVWIEYASRNEDDRIGVYIEEGEVVD